MTRMRAEQEAASRNRDKAMTANGLSYSAGRSLTSESEWAVVTWQHGKPIQREY